MKRISNALIIDDKINLLVNSPDQIDPQNREFKNLKSIHDFFLNHSIPINIIDGLQESIDLLIDKIQRITKPDLVVLDLDLNSNGEVDDYDISLLLVIIQTLKSRFYDFIIVIYSSEGDEWPNIKDQLIEKDDSLSSLLNSANTITLGKSSNWSSQLAENLDFQISEKAIGYFKRQINFINGLYRKAWNTEALVMLCFFSTLIIMIHYSFKSSSSFFLFSNIAIMLIVTLKFISESKK